MVRSPCGGSVRQRRGSSGVAARQPGEGRTSGIPVPGLKALIRTFKALIARLARGWCPGRPSDAEVVEAHVAAAGRLLEEARKTPAHYRAIEAHVRKIEVRVDRAGAVRGLVTVMQREEVWRKPSLLTLALQQLEKAAPSLRLRDALEGLSIKLSTYVKQEVGGRLGAMLAKVQEATQAAREQRDAEWEQAQAAAARARHERALALQQEAFREAIGQPKDQCVRLQGHFEALRGWAEGERARRRRLEEEETTWNQRRAAEQRWREGLEAAEQTCWQGACSPGAWQFRRPWPRSR